MTTRFSLSRLPRHTACACAVALLFTTTIAGAQQDPAAAPTSSDPLPPPSAPAPAPVDPAPPPASPEYAPEPPPPPPRERYEGPTARDRVVAYYTGIQIGISPGIIFPTNGGDVGFLLSLYGGYGIEAGSVVLIPGAHATGAWPSGEFIGTFTPSLKLVFPLGAFAPYIEGGAGPGYVSVGEQVGVAVRAGGGFSVHPSSRFAIGAGVAYQTITGTGVSFLGPVLILSF